MRFLVSPDRSEAVWVHQLEIPTHRSRDWIDCTDMNDDQFMQFMKQPKE